MNQKLQNLIVSSASFPAGLDGRIIMRVEKAIRRSFFEKIAVGSAISLTFGVILFVIGRETLVETATSGFGQYLSLVFSNGMAIMSNWSDFGWTIIESAPITGLALCLGTVGALIVSVRWTGRAWNGFNGAVNMLTA